MAKSKYEWKNCVELPSVSSRASIERKKERKREKKKEKMCMCIYIHIHKWPKIKGQSVFSLY